MKKTKQLFGIMLAGLMMMTSCEGEEDTTDTGCDGLESLALTLSQKADVFNGNPTSSNCSAMKTAAFALINAAQSCDGVTAAQYEAAGQAWTDVDCSAFD